MITPENVVFDDMAELVFCTAAHFRNIFFVNTQPHVYMCLVFHLFENIQTTSELSEKAKFCAAANFLLQMLTFVITLFRLSYLVFYLFNQVTKSLYSHNT